MSQTDTRQKLIEATKKLLTSGTLPKTLTAREISNAAGTNLAMINYCFQSKDELLKIAVDEIVAEEFQEHAQIRSEDISPKEQLRELLIHICDAMVKYRELTRLTIPYLLLNAEISLPLDILPFVTAHFKKRKSETECRVIAFQLVYTLQLIFYREEDFCKYCGIDITKEKQLHDFLDAQLDLYL